MQRYESWSSERAAEIIRQHADRPGATLPILHALQEEFGHVPEEAVPLVADALNLSRAEVHGVVTFYHDFRREPPGRHVLKLCRAEACQAMGGDDLAARAERGSASSSARPPPTAASRSSRSIASACAPRALRHARRRGDRPPRCDAARCAAHGGAAMTPRLHPTRCRRARGRRRRGRRRRSRAGRSAQHPDRDRAHRLARPLLARADARGRDRGRPHGLWPGDGGDVAALLDAGVLAGGAASQAARPARAHSLAARQTRLTFARCGVIDPRSLEDYRAHGGYEGLEQALALGSAGIVER